MICIYMNERIVYQGIINKYHLAGSRTQLINKLTNEHVLVVGDNIAETKRN